MGKRSTVMHRLGGSPLLAVAVMLLAVGGGTMSASAGAIVAGFDSTTLEANDDGSSDLVGIGFEVNYFGVHYTDLFVNNNGNLTFDASLFDFTPFPLSTTSTPIIAPFFADVDTRGLDSGLAQFGQGTFEGRAAFGATWIDVGYFPESVDLLNSFQVLLVDRSDIAAGDFDIIFNYDKIQWEAGSASGGVDGLGGSSARAGFANGLTESGTFFELAGSAVNGAFLDGGPNALISNRFNSSINGRYIFEVRNGIVSRPIPEPSSLVLAGMGALGAIGYGLKRRRRPIVA